MISFEYRKYLEMIKGRTARPSPEKDQGSSTSATHSCRGSTRPGLVVVVHIIVLPVVAACLCYFDAMTKIGSALKKVGLLVGVIGAVSVAVVRADCPDYSDYSLVSLSFHQLVCRVLILIMGVWR